MPHHCDPRKLCVLVCLAFFLFWSVSAAPSQRPTPPPYCKADTPFCIGGTYFKHVNPADVLDVSYGEAPVFKAKFGPLLAIFHLYHTGLLFQNRNTGLNYTVEYDAMFGVPNATIPWIVNGDIVWCDHGGICTLPFVDYEYWLGGGKITPMTTISGAQFNQFVDWLSRANETLTTYELWNIYERWDNGKTPPYLKSTTCAEGVWTFLGALRKMGAQIDMERINPKHDFINLYSDKPVPVNDADPSTKAKLLTFYQDLQWAGKTEEQKLELFLKFLTNDKFVLFGHKYYLLSPMRFPYFGSHYITEPLPDVPINM